MRRPFQRCVYHAGRACSCWDIALWVRRPTLSLLEAEKSVEKGLIKKLNSTERGALFRHFCVSKVITTAHAHKSGVIFHFFSKSFQTKKKLRFYDNYCEFVDVFCRVDSRRRCQWCAERMVEGTLRSRSTHETARKSLSVEPGTPQALPELLLRSRHYHLYHMYTLPSFLGWYFP